MRKVLDNFMWKLLQAQLLPFHTVMVAFQNSHNSCLGCLYVFPYPASSIFKIFQILLATFLHKDLDFFENDKNRRLEIFTYNFVKLSINQLCSSYGWVIPIQLLDSINYPSFVLLYFKFCLSKCGLGWLRQERMWRHGDIIW